MTTPDPSAAAAAIASATNVVIGGAMAAENLSFKTGAVRGSDGAIKPQGWPGGSKAFPVDLHLLFQNTVALRRMGERFGEGAIKYPPKEGEILRNWMKGLPESSLLKHAYHHLAAYMEGDRSEDHLACACWNLMTLMFVQERHPSLLDVTGPVPTGPVPTMITRKEDL